MLDLYMYVRTHYAHTRAVDPSIWHHVTLLYPALVQCITCTSLDVRQALKEALFQFTDLMQLSTRTTGSARKRDS